MVDLFHAVTSLFSSSSSQKMEPRTNAKPLIKENYSGHKISNQRDENQQFTKGLVEVMKGPFVKAEVSTSMKERSAKQETVKPAISLHRYKQE